MHQRQRRREALVAEVGEEAAELGGGEHPLVDEGAARQGGEVDDPLAVAAGHLVLDALAHAVELAVELDAGGPGRDRPRRAGGTPGMTASADGPTSSGRHGHRPPAEEAQALVGHDRSRWRPRPWPAPRRRSGGSRGRRRRRRRGQREAGHGPQEGVGHLHRDTGAVTGVGLGARGAAVRPGCRARQAQLDDPVAGAALHVDHEGDAAGVVFETGVVEAARAAVAGPSSPQPLGRAGGAGDGAGPAAVASSVVESSMNPARMSCPVGLPAGWLGRAGKTGHREPPADGDDGRDHGGAVGSTVEPPAGRGVGRGAWPAAAWWRAGRRLGRTARAGGEQDRPPPLPPC